MPEEIGYLLDNLISVRSLKFGDLELFSGEWLKSNSKKIYVTAAWSGWGKVSAARATTRLLTAKYNDIQVEVVFFTGVAGAVDKRLKQWDIVLSESVIQHDMDASPIFGKYVIPALNEKEIQTNKLLLNKVFEVINKELFKNDYEFGTIYKGLIASGDMFISEKKKIKQLSKEIEGLFAIEMEGAAFAQVAEQEKVDWLVIRVISDSADESAHDDFNAFLNKYKLKSFDLIKCLLNTF